MNKYRANCTFHWDFESEQTQNEVLKLMREKISALSGISDISIKLEKKQEKIQKVCLGEVTPEQVFPFLSRGEEKREYVVEGKKYKVKMNSQRYFLFRECMKCVVCGLGCTKMFLEYHPADKSPHFNFYGEDGDKLILMTKDHIHAKSHGGEDLHSNYQTMCITCNNLKGHHNMTLAAIKELRNVYDQSRTLDKASFKTAIETAKGKLSRPWRQKKAAKRRNSDTLFAAFDLGVWKKDAEIVAKSIYDPHNSEYNYTACIRKGTPLEPLAVFQQQAICEFGDETVLIPMTLLTRD